MASSRERAARRRARFALPGVLAALLLGGLIAAGCSSGPSATGGSSTTGSTTTTSTTTTTTTTLPRTTRVDGSGASSSQESFGAVQRVPVIPVPEGQVDAPFAPTGSALATEAVPIGYHQVGSGPDLLLVMGERGTMTWWDPQLIDQLSQHYRVTFFDLPGVGYSGPDPSATTIESLADLTAGLADALGLVQPVVLGWGMGGEIALSLAERHPGLASRLVLVDTTAGGSSAVPPARAVSEALGSPGRTMVELSRLLFPSGSSVAREAWLDDIGELPIDDITAAAIRREATIQASFYAHDEQVVSALATVTIPVLLVVGSEDEVVPPANAMPLLEGLPHVRRLALAGAGYAGCFQDEDRFVSALETFVDG